MPDWSQLLPMKSAEQLVTQVAAHLRAAGSKLTNWNKGSLLRMLTEAFVQPTADLYAVLFKVVPQGFPHTATGLWLDAHLEGYGDARLGAVKTRGMVTFERAAGGSGNVVIPATTRVATAPQANGQRIAFRPLAEGVLPDGQDEVSLECEAEVAGAGGNVGPGSLVALLTPVAGVEGVNNDDAEWLTLEGADEEEDPRAQERLIQKWAALGWGSNRAAYESWALSVPGVGSVWIDDDHPRGQGTVDVYIMGTAGAPSPALLAAVDAVIQARRSLTANVQVLAPVEVPVAVELAVWLEPGVGSLAEVEAAVTARVQAYFRLGAGVEGVTAIAVAEDVRPGRLEHLARGAADVYDAEAVAPASAVAVSDGHIATLASLQLTVAHLEAL